ncbi:MULTISPECIES: hypothetical protein [Pseudomonas]|uniref:hypothetical protein n=1 Tax=Pseudomonas TaxID=286 RepID=UPI000A49C703|nr:MULTISPECIES: hypothetical protein [Pseudomonas]MBM2564162.1 hypothetical protein [Pseudomonas sp. AF1]MBM2583991.1 hypothetical protein [Pseudomonas sp. AFW1]MBM2591899.1 hypothetical protein [Pseudomonas sp. BIS]MBM2606060.1 hypothetical protein [Pseudomonas sp. BIS1]MCT5796768.1 hypothetical protein [Pseudomonas aeruginosa]
MNAVVQSIGSLSSNDQFPPASEPDKAPQLYGKPAADFVLCRDVSGNATGYTVSQHGILILTG